MTIIIINQSPIVFYQYFDFSDSSFYCELIERYFRQTGHTRNIDFRIWNCYDGLPGRDGDLYSYDAVTLSSLVDKGYVSVLPDVINTDNTFDWIMDRILVRKKSYGIPIMLCSNVIICRKKDDKRIENIMDLKNNVAIPVKSLFMNYYLQAFCNHPDNPKYIKDVIEHIVMLVGKDNIENSRLQDYDGVRKFNEAEVDYFVGFTEAMRLFKKDDYVVRYANLSKNKYDDNLLFMTDLVSLGRNIDADKINDCLDLMKLMSATKFIYELSTEDGKVQYMLPANKKVYPLLAKLDPIYNDFYKMLDNDLNGIIRYSKHFYERFYQTSDEILKTIV